MKQKVYIKQTKPALIVGIIVATIFLIFGISFFVVLNQEGSEIGQGFMVFWILIVLIIGGIAVNNLINYDKNEKITAEVVEFSDTLNNKDSEIPFDEKLRKLEKLKREGFISDKEYTFKRTEIMSQKW